jgi:hypothetical protein
MPHFIIIAYLVHPRYFLLLLATQDIDMCYIPQLFMCESGVEDLRSESLEIFEQK